MSELRGRVVLVTGASAGIGEACARQLAARGARLIISARREERLKALALELLSAGALGVHTAVADVSSIPDVERMHAELPEEFRDVYAIVNNAGLALGAQVTEEHSADFIDRMLDTNVKGIFNVLRAFLPDMKKRNAGHIVNIGSVAGLEAYPMGAGYCASKYAVAGLTRSLRIELVATALRVTHIAPGAVNTEFSTVRFGGDKVRADKFYEGFTPLFADDVADAVTYALTRPPHVQVAEMTLYCTSQAVPTVIARAPASSS